MLVDFVSNAGVDGQDVSSLIPQPLLKPTPLPFPHPPHIHNTHSEHPQRWTGSRFVSVLMAFETFGVFILMEGGDAELCAREERA